MGTIRFGTDGWRAVIAEDFTMRNVARVAQAAADYWRAQPPPGTQPLVVVGYDRRFLSREFAECVAEVMAGNQFRVLLCPDPSPTPSVSFAVRAHQAAGGVMITASHNPARFNGFKLKSHFGGSAGPELCQAVESFLDRHPVQSLPFAEARAAGVVRIRDLRPAHFAAVKRLVDFALISRSRLRFAHEALFGTGAYCFDRLLAGTTCRVTTLNGAHDPLFGGINPEPIEANYGPTQAFLRRHPHDLCLVTDGDADRIGAMDGRGRYVSTHQVICLLLRHLVVRRQGRGRVVKALSTTSMVDKMCAAYGLELTETGVGFKYIGAEMIKGGVLLGGEESGGIAFPGHIPERDGIAGGLMLLEMLATERVAIGRLIARLEREFGPHCYGRKDIHYPLEQRAQLIAHLQRHPPDRLLRSPVAAVRTFDGVKFVAEDSSWLMLRGSGTEPVLRIYAESASRGAVEKLLRLGLKLAGTTP
ncbi:MAG TPA: phosphoglucomutase/phosphomannomutase family protein [Verrucomicrobiota bacterium]|jgi:phosphomannomutase|nr:phosphoglucomutase/phosphomannomutase family protein [Verrucomicrobiota bacterium]HRT57762.1 phosphoglucomutase/phosphomannomutase family protein [Candidatus Paceibacterota bacterium]